MKKIMCLAFMMALIFGGSSVWAEGVYLQPGGVGTKITSLPYTINQPGYYYFGGNLAVSLTGNNAAITVNANNVTLDLMGFSLSNTYASSPAGYGIRMIGRTNVEIRNGTIVKFQEGIWESSTSGANHVLSNLRLNNCSDAIFLQGKNHLVKNCTASNNYFGIAINSGTISNCVACDNTNIGIRLTGAGSVLGNIAYNNTTRNFSLGTASTATNIMVNRNSASGLTPDYYKPTGSTGVVISELNAGTR
ncbi:MAG: right-handed parallel beta-helix repeat-containing protein [Desulfobacterales bacterium]|nr:right-handed parallel beta-helix repeat-containing protein [Pseudomonadota bacterium]MBU4356671.1 right-handed parallel beta-helix repeat-containing protein [Pseudomonadota bacterium]MCG2773979.1 right-handed parallel beta-helix repeat-containing protein [Desulfobacterales bacterium]